MRRILILATIFLSFQTIGQTLNQKDLLDIVQLALIQNKLSSGLVPKLDTLFNGQVTKPHVIIKADEKFGIKRQYDDMTSKVMVWEGEEIFVYNIQYWLTLLETSRKKDKALIRYETTNFGMKQGVISTCYKGKIKGKFNGEKWTILKSEFVQADCNYKQLSEE